MTVFYNDFRRASKLLSYQVALVWRWLVDG
jgi:hypothetical protein